MSHEEPPVEGPGMPPERPREWQRRFDPYTGEPLNAGDPAPGTNEPMSPPRTTPAPGGPDDQGAPGARPGGFRPPSAPTTPWQGIPVAPRPGSFPSPHGFGVSTDALGRTLQPPHRPSTPGRGTVVALSALALLLVGSVATGTFLFIKRDDDTTPVAGGPEPSASARVSPGGGASSTASPSPESSASSTDQASPEASEPTGDATASGTPTPARPRPGEELPTYGARINVQEFDDNWDFRFGDVELDTVAVSAVNYPSCAEVATGSALKDAGCVYAGQTIQKNTADQVLVTAFVLEFKNAKQATAAEATLTDQDFDLGGGRTFKGSEHGMWRALSADEYVVFSVATTTDPKIDERLLNRYAGYRAADLTGAIRFM